MSPQHIEILVEEPSMEVFLDAVLPRILNSDTTFSIHVHLGKKDLLKKLAGRLKGYAKWLPENTRIVVIVDRDDDRCTELKSIMDNAANEAGLVTRSQDNLNWKVANRIAIEELEAWYFGDWNAVWKAFPRVNQNIANKASYRFCDDIAGGTWEAIERIFKSHGYFTSGLRKVELAGLVAEKFSPAGCLSPSFQKLRSALLECNEK